MRKIASLILMAFIAADSVFALEIPDVSAASAAVMECESGKILYEKNADTKRGMASTTKIMTAIVAFEKGKKDDVVKISAKSANIEGSSMYLKEGEKLTLENLVLGLMLVSGNDAATAIAEHIAGSEEKFAELMNEKAKEIGAENTHFTNPHGLSDENHYTTAYDLAKITAYALENPDFARIVSTKSITIEREGLGKTLLVNHNKLLKLYEDCKGVKTGFTKATGRCLVSAWEKDGAKIVCVTLNAGDDWNDHKRMRDYAFEKFKVKLYKRCGTVAGFAEVDGGECEEVNGIYGDDIYLWGENDKEWNIKSKISYSLKAPVKRGQIIGEAVAISESGEEKRFDILAEKDIEKVGAKSEANLKDRMKFVFYRWLVSFI